MSVVQEISNGLAERATKARREALSNYRSLVAHVATGLDLDAKQIDKLAAAMEAISEPARGWAVDHEVFRRDVEVSHEMNGEEAVNASYEADVERLGKETIRLTTEIKAVKQQLIELDHQYRRINSQLDNVHYTKRHYTRLRSLNPRLFGEIAAALHARESVNSCLMGSIDNRPPGSRSMLDNYRV